MLLVVTIVACIIDHCCINYYVDSSIHTVTTYQLATRMATSISIQSFNASKVEWDSWSRRFDHWLKISTHSEGEHATDKMRAAFCSFTGSDTFKLLYSQYTLKKPEKRMYDALKTKLDAQYGVKRLVLVERYHFYNITSRQMVNH